MPPSKFADLASFLPKSSLPFETPLTHIITPTTSVSNTGVSSMSMQVLPMPTLRPDRPAMLVSSTSWTSDEDFSILLDAIVLYEIRAQIINAQNSKVSSLPKLFVVVTGKGPLRKKYLEDIARLQDEQGWKWVRCISMWLDAEDYPLFLGKHGILFYASWNDGVTSPQDQPISESLFTQVHQR